MHCTLTHLLKKIHKLSYIILLIYPTWTNSILLTYSYLKVTNRNFPTKQYIFRAKLYSSPIFFFTPIEMVKLVTFGMCVFNPSHYTNPNLWSITPIKRHCNRQLKAEFPAQELVFPEYIISKNIICLCLYTFSAYVLVITRRLFLNVTPLFQWSPLWPKSSNSWFTSLSSGPKIVVLYSTDSRGLTTKIT